LFAVLDAVALLPVGAGDADLTLSPRAVVVLGRVLGHVLVIDAAHLDQLLLEVAVDETFPLVAGEFALLEVGAVVSFAHELLDLLPLAVDLVVLKLVGRLELGKVHHELALLYVLAAHVEAHLMLRLLLHHSVLFDFLLLLRLRVAYGRAGVGGLFVFLVVADVVELGFSGSVCPVVGV